MDCFLEHAPWAPGLLAWLLEQEKVAHAELLPAHLLAVSARHIMAFVNACQDVEPP